MALKLPLEELVRAEVSTMAKIELNLAKPTPGRDGQAL
jgi:hypothetical protein